MENPGRRLRRPVQNLSVGSNLFLKIRLPASAAAAGKYAALETLFGTRLSF
jgi:hypothetical protein